MTALTSERWFRSDLSIYNAGVIAARAAYRLDQLKQNGLCVRCEVRRSNYARHVCEKCRKATR